MTSINRPGDPIAQGDKASKTQDKAKAQGALNAKLSEEVTAVQIPKRSNRTKNNLKSVWAQPSPASSSKAIETQIASSTSKALEIPKAAEPVQKQQPTSPQDGKLQVAKQAHQLLKEQRANAKTPAERDSIRLMLRENVLNMNSIKAENAVSSARDALKETTAEYEKIKTQLKNASAFESMRLVDKLTSVQGQLTNCKQDLVKAEASMNAATLRKDLFIQQGGNTASPEWTNLQKAKIEKEKAVAAGRPDLVKKAEEKMVERQRIADLGNAIKEVVSTERSYLSSLQRFDKELDALMAKSPSLKRSLGEGSAKLKEHMAKATEFSKQIDRMGDPPTQADIEALYSSSSFRKGYTNTAMEFIPFQLELQRNLEKVNLAEIYPSLPRSRANEIKSVLSSSPILPVQRMPRHAMLMDAVSKFADKDEQAGMRAIFNDITALTKAGNEKIGVIMDARKVQDDKLIIIESQIKKFSSVKKKKEELDKIMIGLKVLSLSERSSVREETRRLMRELQDDKEAVKIIQKTSSLNKDYQEVATILNKELR